MHTSEFIRLYVSPQNSFNQSTLIVAKLDNDTKSQPESKDISCVAVFLAPICFMIVWGVVIYAVSKIRKIAQVKDGIETSDRLQQHPCRNCQFFKDNHYLNCAVQPSTVLTKQALNCLDYSSK